MGGGGEGSVILTNQSPLSFQVYFVYTEKVTKNCFWAIFVVGVFIMIECLSTDIIVFTI